MCGITLSSNIACVFQLKTHKNGTFNRKRQWSFTQGFATHPHKGLKNKMKTEKKPQT
jgi:hypothetical protein